MGDVIRKSSTISLALVLVVIATLVKGKIISVFYQWLYFCNLSVDVESTGKNKHVPLYSKGPTLTSSSLLKIEPIYFKATVDLHLVVKFLMYLFHYCKISSTYRSGLLFRKHPDTKVQNLVRSVIIRMK